MSSRCQKHKQCSLKDDAVIDLFRYIPNHVSDANKPIVKYASPTWSFFQEEDRLLAVDSQPNKVTQKQEIPKVLRPNTNLAS
jgi:hypothetical protein